MREPKQVRSKDSTEQMLSATLDLMSDGGLRAVTIAAVSERSGQSNGSLYHRFHTRMALIVAAQNQFLDSVEAGLADMIDRASDEPDDRAAVEILTREYVELFSANRGVFRALMMEGADFPPLKERGTDTSRRRQESVIAWFRSRFDTPTTSAAAAAYLLLASTMTRVFLDDDAVMPAIAGDSQLGSVLIDAIMGIVSPGSTVRELTGQSGS